MSARDDILSSLRATLAQPELRFPPAEPSPLDLDRMTVTEATGGPYELAYRFGEELVTLHGSYEIVESPAEARLTLLNRLVEWIDAEDAARKGAVIETASGAKRTVVGSGAAAHRRADGRPGRHESAAGSAGKPGQ